MFTAAPEKIWGSNPHYPIQNIGLDAGGACTILFTAKLSFFKNFSKSHADPGGDGEALSGIAYSIWYLRGFDGSSMSPFWFSTWLTP